MLIITSAALCFYCLGYGAAGGGGKLGRGNTWDIIASFALLPQHGDPLVNVSWTLKYEIAFYGLFGLCILNRAFGLLVMGLWQAAALVAAIYAPHLADGLGGFYLRSLVLEFAVGMGCAWLLRQSWFERLFAKQGWRLAAVGAVVFGLGMRGGYGVCCACGAALLILGLMLAERSAGGLRLPSALIALGDASYAIYLVHFSVAAILMSLTIRLHLPLNSAVALAIAVVATAAGVAIDRIVDRPVQRLLARRSRPVAAPANQHMILNA